MGATYTRQSSYSDGDIITAAHTNDEFNQLLAAFQASTGHTHDGAANEGGPITKMLGTSLTLGDGTAATDITVTFDGETNDGVLKWMEDEDYFEFSDDILVATNEKLQFRDTAIYINSSTDGQLDLIADGAVVIDTAGDITLDADGGDVFFKDGGTTYGSLTNTSGNLIIKSGTTTALTFSGANATFAGTVTIGSAEISEAELEILDGATVTTDELNILDGVTATTAEINIIDGDTSATSTTIADADRVVLNDNGTMVQAAVTDLDTYFSATTKTLTNKTLTTPVITEIDSGSTITLDATTDIVLDADGGDIFFKDGGTTFGSATNSSGDLIIKSGTTTALTFSGADVTIAGDLTISGDDLTMGTNTSGHIMVADGTNFNPVAVSGDVTIASNGAVTIADDAVETAMVNANVITGQTAETSIDNTNDTLLMHDNSASALRKITVASLSTALGGLSDIVGDTTPQLGGDLDVNGNDIVSTSNGNITLTPNGTGVVRVDGSNGIDMQSGGISIKNSGAESYVRFYCESSNAHYSQLQASPHSAYSGNVTLVLPASADTLVGRATTDTLTNKTLTTPVISSISNTGTITLPTSTDTLVGRTTTDTLTNKSIDSDNNTITNIVNADIKASAAIADTKLATISTADKVSLSALDIDGGSDIGADLTTSDLIVVDDGAGGTNRKAALSRLTTFMQGQGFSSEDPTALAIALG